MLLRIIWIDVHRVRPLEHGVPFGPFLGDVALASTTTSLCSQRASTPRAFPILSASSGVRPVRLRPAKRLPAPAKRCGTGPRRSETKGSAELWNRRVRRPLQERQFAALRDKHTIRALGDKYPPRAPAPMLMPGQLTEKRLRPDHDGLVRPGDISPPFVRNSRESGARPRCACTFWILLSKSDPPANPPRPSHKRTDHGSISHGSPPWHCSYPRQGLRHFRVVEDSPQETFSQICTDEPQVAHGFFFLLPGARGGIISLKHPETE